MSIDTNVTICDFNSTREGLESMLTAAIGDHGYRLQHVDLSVACMVLIIALRAPDLDEWFPHGKWATLQRIQGGIEESMKQIKWPDKAE
jgi:hypothetical protein